MSVLLAQAGCPVEFIGLVISIDTLSDMLNTPSTCVGNIACTAITAAQEKILDLEKYSA